MDQGQMQVITEEHASTGGQTTLVLVAIFTTYFASTFFVRAMNVAMPRIAAELNGMPLYSWAISLPALSGAIVTLVFGKLSDIYGRRIILTLSLALFLVGALLAAVSRTFEFNIAARVIIGFGQGSLAPLCFSTIADLFSPTERSRWSGLLNIPSGTTAVIGPTLVGLITDNLSWRYLFWITAVLITISGVLVFSCLRASAKRSAHRIDFPGAFLLTAASATMILGFSWAGTTYPWSSVQILGLLGASAVFWIVFLFVEERSEEPMLEPQVLRNRTFLTAALAAFMSFFGLLGIVMYYPLFLQGVQGASATLSGQLITPYSVLTAFIGVPAGFLLARTRRCRGMYVVGYAVLTLSMVGMAVLNERTPLWFGLLVTSCAGLGLGAIPTINTLVAQFSVPKRLLGVAVGAMFFFVITGRAIAPAILGSAMNATYVKTLEASLPAELKELRRNATWVSLTDMRVLISAEARNDLRKACNALGVRGTAVFEEAITAIRKALEAGLRMIFLIGVVTMLVSFLIILTIPEVSMDVEALDKRPPVRI